MLVLVAPGQGAQAPGFLTPWLELPGFADRLTWWSAVADLDLVHYGTEADADTIRDTAVAQPLLVASGLAAFGALGLAPERLGAVAGHSVGEITAAAIAGTLSAESALAFVRQRGLAMAEAAAQTATGMAAVLGGDPDEVAAVIEKHGLTPANNNGGGQIVAAGTLEQLEAFKADPRVAYVSNADGKTVEGGAEVVARLVSQVSNPVRWDLCMEALERLGATCVIEVPPAGTLTNLVKRNLKGVAHLALKTPADLDKARELIAEHAPQGA